MNDNFTRGLHQVINIKRAFESKSFLLWVGNYRGTIESLGIPKEFQFCKGVVLPRSD